MSRTYKKHPHGCHRSLHGYHRVLKQSIDDNDGIPSIRKGAIPPDPWDDLPIDRQAWRARRVFDEMLKNGISVEEASLRLLRKFHIPYCQSLEFARDFFYHLSYKNPFEDTGE